VIGCAGSSGWTRTPRPECGWPIRTSTEAITSRPLLHGVGRQTRHANQTTITITSTHGKAGHVRRMLAEVTVFFKSLRPIAEQLSDLDRWYRILSRALVKYLKGRQLGPPPAAFTRLIPPAARSHTDGKVYQPTAGFRIIGNTDIMGRRRALRWP
jgi:hypothetical protein